MADTGLHAASRLDDPRAQAFMHHTLATAYKESGRLEQAAEHHHAALALRTRTRDWAGVAESANGLGLVHLWRHEPAPARTRLEQALAFYQQYGPAHRVGPVLNNLAYAAADLSEPQQAARLAHQALAVYRDTHADTYLHVDPLLLLSRIAREAGQPDQAQPHLDQALALLEDSTHPAFEAATRLEQAAVLREQGHHNQAFQAYWACETLQRTLGNRTAQALAHDGIGQTLRALGRLEEAIDFHRTAARILRAPLTPWNLAQCLTHLADAHTDNHQPDQARQCRTEALTLLAEFTDLQATALREHLQALTQG
ncbi:tetratricopeptide repeat protein [Streptomyces specialis]|uniref:tetratricopeptide repeat protein n=1 Tax=Streptomyces specialis TaxID=498367 RepID=UPI002D21ADAA|nr:tetratricopeptide repeat protein [Streptomyces specialis]